MSRRATHARSRARGRLQGSTERNRGATRSYHPEIARREVCKLRSTASVTPAAPSGCAETKSKLGDVCRLQRRMPAEGKSSACAGNDTSEFSVLVLTTNGNRIVMMMKMKMKVKMKMTMVMTVMMTMMMMMMMTY